MVKFVYYIGFSPTADRVTFSAEPTTETERLGITMLINDKSQLKRDVEQIGFQLALKTSKSLG